MKFRPLYFLVLLAATMNSCEERTATNIDSDLPLQSSYQYFDNLSDTEFKFVELDHRLNIAKGGGNKEKIDTLTKQFESSQASCIQKMEAKFPTGSIQIPFEQIHGKDTLSVKSVYLSGYAFPWNTATTICFYFTVEYKLHKNDILFVPISLKFIDSENDIINSLNLAANTSGKSRVLVRAQSTFRDLKKLIINQ